MSLLSILATVFGVVVGLSQLPQAIKIFRRKSAKDISILTYLMISAGGIVWILYGFEIKSIPVIATNLVGAVGVVMIITGWFLYGRK